MWPHGVPPDDERLPTDPEQTVEAAEEEDQISTLLRDPVIRWRAKILADLRRL